MNPSNYTAHVVGLEEALIHPTTTTRHASFTIISLLRSILRNKISNTFMWSWDWASLGYALVAWQLATIIWKFWWKSPVRSQDPASNWLADTDHKSVKLDHCCVSHAAGKMRDRIAYDFRLRNSHSAGL